MGNPLFMPKKVVAVLGPQASFSEEAAIRLHGKDIEIIYAETFDGVAVLVERKEADCGIIPIETTKGGIIPEALEALMDHPINITGEIIFEPQFCLLGKGEIKKIKRIGSKQQALVACKKYLDENFPGVAREETSSTSHAAELASKDPTYAAIASERAAEIYGLKVLYQFPVEEGKKLTQPGFRMFVYNRESRTVETVVEGDMPDVSKLPKIIEKNIIRFLADKRLTESSK